MGTRALRQHYGDDQVIFEVDAALGDPRGPWAQHRLRFLGALEDLDPADWSKPTRCEGWDAIDVINHLITADAFWVASLTGARAGAPTEILRGFDPAGGPASMVATMRDATPTEVLEGFRTGQAALADAIAAMGDDDWAAIGEAPPGHVSARLVLAHALWDSWEHERDVLLPLGSPPPVEPDELAVVTWYALGLALVEGGLRGDPAPVGPGLIEPIDVTVAFDDLPGPPWRVRVDAGVRIEPGEPSEAVAVGSAVDLVEGFSGRGPLPEGLPPALHDQLARAAQVL